MTHWNSSYYRNKNYNRVIKGSIDSIINEIQFLPVENEICDEFLESIKNNNVSYSDIIKFIVLSPSLTFNILNLAQSPFGSLSNKNISKFEDAFKVIGDDIVIHLINDFLTRSSVSGAGGNRVPCLNGEYYGSLKSAHFSALLAEELGFSSPFTAYIAALLHNIGAAGMSVRFPIQYSRMKMADNLNYSEQTAAEDDAFGINHCFLGARMVERWVSFPFISDALYYHHHPLEKIKNASTLVKLVYFSAMIDNSGTSDPSLIKETGKELLGFSGGQVDEYISIAELKVQNRLMHLGIEVTDNNSGQVYQPGYKKEDIKISGSGNNNSILSALVNQVYNSGDSKNVLTRIGKSINILTGLNEIFYFKFNKKSNTLDGQNISLSDDTDFSNEFSIPLDVKSSIIVTSFLMGMDINSLDRVNNAEPALFDHQLLNYMGADGLYCLPLIDKDKTTGIIVLGISSTGAAAERDTVEKLRYFLEAVIPLLSDEKVETAHDAENKKPESNPLQTRKLIHEINNPLSAIKNYLKVLSMKLDDVNVEKNEISIIDDELNRIAKLLKEFKSDSPQKTAEKSASNINKIISDTILLIKNSRVNGPEINIDFKRNEEVPDIKIDKDAFRQVLINLINNSIEAMPMGGNISVGVQYQNGDQQGSTQLPFSGNREKNIQISIQDDGPGFPDQLKSNLFKNQSTTKADHDGLGLIIVHELIKKMGGSVVLDDQLKRGACFKITLPAG